MLELIKQPWPWFISGFAISTVMVALLYFGRTFGFSSNLRTICAMSYVSRRVPLFDFNWRGQVWNLLFLFGAVAGGFVSSHWLATPAQLQLSAATVEDLAKLGLRFDGQLNPSQLFGNEAVASPRTILVLLIGGALVGFGSRYAGGCTSGHAISGLSNLQIPSLLAVAGFFAGGLVMTHLIFPLLF